MKFNFGFTIILISLSTSATAGWFISDGDTFEECLENRRSDIHNKSQLDVAAAYCQSKHPYKAPPLRAYEPVTLHSILAVGTGDSKLWNLTTNITITSWGIGDWISTLAARATNRNYFPIDGLIIGTLPSATKRPCPNDHRAYQEVVTCYGKAFPNQSGTFSCLDLHPAKNKKESHGFCLLGFVVKSTESDYKKFIN